MPTTATTLSYTHGTDTPVTISLDLTDAQYAWFVGFIEGAVEQTKNTAPDAAPPSSN